MESAIILGLTIIAVLLLGPWIVAFRALHKARGNARLAQERWDILQARLANVEGGLKGVKAAFERLEKNVTDSRATEAAPPPIQEVPPVREAEVRAPEPPQMVRHDFRPAPPAPPEPPKPAVPQEITPLEGAGVVSPPKTVEPVKPTAAPIAKQPQAARPKLGLEEKVGTNWLNKIGIVLLVLGVAFLISTLMKTLGPAGKVLVGFAVSGALLFAGAFFERNERYRVLARAGIGGGWALLFFTAYAMHHVAAARVIDSQALDLLLMMGVAAGMVWHTLRYNSQVVTGLAFLLAFITINISRVSVFSLTAGVVLAAALCVFVVRRRWFELEVFGILATYLNHWFWLRPIIEPMGGQHRAFPEFLASAGILCSYWFIFRVSYIIRQTGANENAESISSFAALLNGGLLLALMRYQSVRPELAFWFLLGLGFAELLIGQLPITRRRRSAFVVLTVLGSALIVAAIPFRYSGMSLTVLWIAEAQALLLVGIGTDEPVFRRLGLLSMAAPIFEVIFLDANRASVAPDPKLGMVCAFTALACYADAEWFQRRWPRMFNEIYEGWYLTGLSYAGMIVAMLAAWVGLHDAWVGVVWAVLGFVLAFIGNRLRIATLSTQANILAAAALFRVLVVNVDLPGQFHAIGLRLITVSCVAALLYLSAPWTSIEHRGRVPAVYTWAGSFLVALLAWYELRPISVALAWALFGVLLIELGLMRRMRELVDQGLIALAAAFTRIFFVNLNADVTAGQLSPRVYTVVPLALIFYYAYERLRSVEISEAKADVIADFEQQYAVPILSWFGAIAVASVIRFELNVDWVVAAWAAGVAVLLLVSIALKRRVFLHQALAAAVAVLFRGIFHNFYQHSYFSGNWGPASKAIVVAAALLFASLPLAFRLRGIFAKEIGSSVPGTNVLSRFLRALELHPHQPLFFVPLGLVTAVLAIELRSGVITLAWGIESVIVFLLALWIGERSYRLSGLGLLLLCVGKLLVIDVWRMEATDRYVTLIVMGASVLLVSFLYTRYREALREYL
jgi:uncharacterized membrane protein